MLITFSETESRVYFSKILETPLKIQVIECVTGTDYGCLGGCPRRHAGCGRNQGRMLCFVTQTRLLALGTMMIKGPRQSLQASRVTALEVGQAEPNRLLWID